MIGNIFICIALGYIFGLIQGAFIVGKIKSVDLRCLGSGNLGTTNVIRNIGFKWGAITYIIDALKSIFSCVLIYFLFISQSEQLIMLQLYGLLGVLLGHSFPFYLKFKGGKGIASFSGGMLIIYFPVGLVAVLTFVVVLFITKYVSLSSMALSGVAAMFMSILTLFNFFSTVPIVKFNIIILVIVLFLLTVFTHRSNIIRILTGTENRVKSKLKER